MSLIKCPKCGEMFSDSYKTCPFCEEDEAYYSGKLRKSRGRRAAESRRRKTPSVLGPVAIVVLILLAALVVWLIFGDQIKEAITGEKPPITDVDKPDDTIDKPDDTPVTPTISLNRTVLVLNVGDKDELKVNGTEDAAAWSSSAPTVASVNSAGEVTALTKGNAVITAEVHAVVGFKSKDVVILEDKFKAVSSVLKVCTDDGSYGRKGLVTEALKELLDEGNVYDEIFAIGPMVMMKFVCKTTAPYNMPTTVSMSPIMIDGTGMCGGCRLTVGGETKFACVDGPDFDGQKVDWDLAVKRNQMYHDFEVRKHEEVCNLFKQEVK